MSGHLISVAPVFLVANLDRALAYYRDRLGFAAGFVYGNAYAGISREGCALHLKQATPVQRDQEAFEAAEHLDACFGVRDARALAADFAERGAHVSVAMREMPYGSEFYVRDPDGHILGFVEARGAGLSTMPAIAAAMTDNCGLCPSPSKPRRTSRRCAKPAGLRPKCSR
jgi:predicted enzyme related to lactoylglutathione lyase